MSILVKKIVTHIGADGKLEINLSNLPSGDIEIELYKMEKEEIHGEFSSLIPKHKLGKISSSLRREDVYDDAR